MNAAEVFKENVKLFPTRWPNDIINIFEPQVTIINLSPPYFLDRLTNTGDRGEFIGTPLLIRLLTIVS